MDVQVLDFDLAAAFPKCSGKEFRETACTVATACSLAYSELLSARCAECRTGPYARAQTEVRLRPTGGAPILRS